MQPLIGGTREGDVSMRMKSDTMLNYERTLQEDESNFHKSLHFFIC
jgi:hypothetical protein